MSASFYLLCTSSYASTKRGGLYSSYSARKVWHRAWIVRFSKKRFYNFGHQKVEYIWTQDSSHTGTHCYLLGFSRRHWSAGGKVRLKRLPLRNHGPLRFNIEQIDSCIKFYPRQDSRIWDDRPFLALHRSNNFYSLSWKERPVLPQIVLSNSDLLRLL